MQIKARTELQPLIDIVLARCSYIMKRLFVISASVMKTTEQVRIRNLFKRLMPTTKNINRV